MELDLEEVKELARMVGFEISVRFPSPFIVFIPYSSTRFCEVLIDVCMVWCGAVRCGKE